MATYSEKVYANEPGFIEMLGGEAKDESGVLVGTFNGVVVTRLSIVDASRVRREFLLTARAAEEIGAQRARFYERSREAGFVSIVAARDPRAMLQANAGAASGAAIHEVAQRGRAAAEGAPQRVETLLRGTLAAVNGRDAETPAVDVPAKSSAVSRRPISPDDATRKAAAKRGPARTTARRGRGK